MTVDFALIAASLLLATASLATALWGKSTWLRPLSTLSWAGILAGFLTIYFAAATQLPSALATAVFAMVATLPTRISDPTHRRVASALTAGLGSVISLCAMGWSTQWAEVMTRQMDPSVLVLLTALFCALAVTSALALQATVLQAGKARHRALAAWMGALAISVGVTGLLRGTLSGWQWAMKLEGVRWQIPAVLGAAKDFGFDLHMPLQGMTLLLLGLAVVCAALTVMPRVPRLLWALPLGVSTAAIALIVRAIAAPTLPSLDAIRTYASSVRNSQGVPEALIAKGSVVGTLSGIPVTGALPELGMLGAVCVIALVALRFGDTKAETSAHEAHALAHLWGRDFARRAVATGWASWMLAVVTTWRMTSTYGSSGPAEWWAVGVLLAMTGVVVMMRMPGAYVRQASAVSLGMIWGLGVGVALAFGHVFGLSL